MARYYFNNCGAVVRRWLGNSGVEGSKLFLDHHLVRQPWHSHKTFVSESLTELINVSLKLWDNTRLTCEWNSHVFYICARDANLGQQTTYYMTRYIFATGFVNGGSVARRRSCNLKLRNLSKKFIYGVGMVYKLEVYGLSSARPDFDDSSANF
ncbi:hypothetical protein OUZ56_011140 [Daphnia magna]|uniref:Uncharacterized protein n=1 Tax=Daphnia magna TaxID=35525 RepID=A0ABQ9Z0N2_9CRUS|nr:hypothetical protein OUZ56_011140 [Daphnia magna]